MNGSFYSKNNLNLDGDIAIEKNYISPLLDSYWRCELALFHMPSYRTTFLITDLSIFSMK